MYDKMPFGLMNAGATFQMDMDIAFVGENEKFVVIYKMILQSFPSLMKII